MRYLFVCGTPRSGTTATWRLLASDKRLVIGLERYGTRFFRGALTPFLFTPERFMTLQEGDTFYPDLIGFSKYYRDAAERIGEAEYVGDKIPLLYNYLERLFSSIPSAKVVLLIRNVLDVASSYEARADNPEDHSWSRDKRTAEAIKDWNASLEVAKRFRNDARVCCVVYEDFFFGESNGLDLLYKFLDLPLTDDVAAAHKTILERARELESRRRRDLPAEKVMELLMEGAFDTYRELVREIRERNRVISTGSAPG